MAIVQSPAKRRSIVAATSNNDIRMKMMFFVLGAILGIVIYDTAVPISHCDNSINDAESGTLLAELLPQPRESQYAQPPPLPNLKSSKPMFLAQDGYKPEYEKRYYMPCQPLKTCHYAQRALRELGWEKVNDWENATTRLVWSGAAHSEPEFWNKVLQPYQRYNHLPSTLHKPTAHMRFHMTLPKIQRYLKQEASFDDASDTAKKFEYFPPSYPLDTHLPQALEELKSKNSKGPLWAFVNKAGQTLYHTNSAMLVEKHLEVQHSFNFTQQHLNRYVCNRLIWNGMQFIVRIFWLVGSLDPLLVFYQDGFVRVGYSHNNANYLDNDDEVLQFADLEEFLVKKWKQSRVLRRTIDHPLQHVRNQFKEAIVSLVDVHRADVFDGGIHRKGHEDAFELFSADFTIDTDLNVHLSHMYSDTDHGYKHAPFFGEDYYFLVQKNHELWYSMMLTLEEIWYKQEHQLPMVPLQKTGKFQLIVAGNEWKFEYDAHPNRATKEKNQNKKELPVCEVHKDEKIYASALQEVMPAPYNNEEDDYEDDTQK